MSIDILVVGKMHPLLMRHLEQHFCVHKLWEAPNQDVFLKACGPRIRGLVTSGNPALGASKALLDRLPVLEVISVHGVGYDPVDTQSAAQRGIVVTNTPGVPAASVGELAIGLMLALARNICAADRMVRTGNWPERGPYPLGMTLRGKVCGIVGMGQSGQQVARLAQGMGMEIHYYNRSPKADLPYVGHASLKSLAEAARFLVLCVAGGAGTRKMINAEVLAALGSEGYLVNLARGTVVDEPALIMALQQGVIAGAGLDVYAAEPQVPEELYPMDNVVLLPHLGSSTVETRAAMAQLTFDNLQDYFAGGNLQHRVV